MKKLRQYYLPLVMALIGGLAIGMLPISPGYAGNLPACFNGSSPAPSVKFSVGGQQINAACLVTLNNTLIVSATNVPTQNGTALLNAMNLIIAASPTITSPWLLKLEPGTYDLGNLSLTMYPYIQVEGSGEAASVIVGNGQPTATIGVVIGASNSELHSLTIQSRTGNNYSTGIYAGNSVDSSFKINQVTVQSSGGSFYNTGIYNDLGSPTLDNLTVLVTTTTNGNSYGISNNTNSSRIQNSRVTARSSGTGFAVGIYNFGSNTVLLKNVTVTAATTGTGASYGIENNDVGNPLIQSTNVTALTTGGGDGYGIYVIGSGTTQVEDSNITAITNGANYAQGILNNAGGNPSPTIILRRSTVYASASNKPNCNAFGVDTFGGAVSIYDSHLTNVAGSGCLAFGLLLQGTPNTITAINSYVKSGNYGLFNSTVNKINIGTSQLDVPTLLYPGSNALCINSFKGDFTATTASCS